MRTECIAIQGNTPGTRVELSALHYGEAGSGPKAYIQAGLHANEAPGMLAAHHLRERLAVLEAEGTIRGEIILVPAANPLGFAQHLLGSHQGRFALGDGVNFNRNFPYLLEAVAERVERGLTNDGQQNQALIRAALHVAIAEVACIRPAEHLKRKLLSLAIDADTVLDLHCDGEAEMHLYTLPSQVEAFAPLSRLLGARAVLTSTESGDHPFDEAISRLWVDLARHFPNAPIPEASIACTVELRGEADVGHALAASDAEAIMGFLAARGHLAQEAQALPPALCEPTPLEGTEALFAPVSGLIVYHRQVGDWIRTGDLVVEIIDPMDGHVVPVRATTEGRLFARAADRFAHAGKRLGKIAGKVPFRTGKLLSP